jgi:hypothetical protein
VGQGNGGVEPGIGFWSEGIERSGRKAERPVSQFVILLLAIFVSTGVAPTRTPLACTTAKVVVVDAPSGSSSSSTEEHLAFWIDETAKTIIFVDGTPLTIKRFDDRWISAASGDISYEFDRQSNTVTYAGTSMRDGIATIVIGSGRCSIATAPTGR